MDLREAEMFCREIELSDDEDGLVVKVAQVPEGDTGVYITYIHIIYVVTQGWSSGTPP